MDIITSSCMLTHMLFNARHNDFYAAGFKIWELFKRKTKIHNIKTKFVSKLDNSSIFSNWVDNILQETSTTENSEKLHSNIITTSIHFLYYNQNTIQTQYILLIQILPISFPIQQSTFYILICGKKYERFFFFENIGKCMQKVSTFWKNV